MQNGAETSNRDYNSRPEALARDAANKSAKTSIILFMVRSKHLMFVKTFLFLFLALASWRKLPFKRI